MLLGIDVGTTSTKAVIIDGSGRTLGSGVDAYETQRPRDGWSEQDPARWWTAAAKAIAAAIDASGVGGAAIRSVGFSGQMHGSVLLDRAAVEGAAGGPVRALRPALLWNDQRTAAECERIERAVGGGAALVRAVGNRALTGFTLPKLLWVREHEPEVFARVAAALLPKDFVRLQLTGALGTDVGDASGTLLLNPERRAWSGEVAQALGIDAAVLPPVVESTEVVGRVTRWAASQTGLAAGTPVVAGSGDNQAGAVGAGVVRSGLAMASLGTSGVVYVHSSEPRRDLAEPGTPGRVHTLCAPDGAGGRAGGWCLTGCMLSAAGSLHWARDVITPGVDFDVLIAEAGAISPGAGGLAFLPYLSGERCPYPDPMARGAWVGLRAHHTRGHLVRAVLEGVTYTMAQMLSLIRGLPAPVERVRLSGGGNQSAIWRQMQANVYGLPVATVNNDEGPAFGAALLAGVGVGVWESVAAACAATVREHEVHEPDTASAAAYAEIGSMYATMYPRLAPTMHALSRLADRAG